MLSPAFPSGIIPMPQKLLQVLTLGHCSHEFSWPRRAEGGDYYQVCLLCGVEYQYDWKTMRRAGKLRRPAAQATPNHERGHGKKPAWVPRARRLKLHTPLRYREKTQAAWQQGTVDNLSQSGILFRGPHHLPQNAIVELRFEMPEEISGQKNSLVLCQARIIRSKEKPDPSGVVTLAATILNYQFLHEK
jgi:hypothetical protein